MSTHQEPVGPSLRQEDEGSDFDRQDQATETGEPAPDRDPEVAAEVAAGRVPAETNPADAADQELEVPAVAEDDDDDELCTCTHGGRGAIAPLPP